MQAQIFPQSLSGSVDKIYSKSYIHRVIICFFLEHINSLFNNSFLIETYLSSKKNIKLFNKQNGCEDTKSTFTAMEELTRYLISISKSTKPRNVDNTFLSLNCDNSASTLRMIVPIICILKIKCKLYMSKQLSLRIVDSDFHILKPILKAYNIRITIQKSGIDNYVVIKPVDNSTQSFTQDLSPIPEFIVDNISTSQVLSGLLIAQLLSKTSFKFTVTRSLPSFSYIKITLDVLSHFGLYFKKLANNTIYGNGEDVTIDFPYSIESYRDKKSNILLFLNDSKWEEIFDKMVPLDYSLAATWVCSNFLSGSKSLGSLPIHICGFNEHSKEIQDDIKVFEILKRLEEDAKNKITSIIDCSNIPDIIPLLSICAASINGHITRFENIKRLRMKESNRVKSSKYLVEILGGYFLEYEDSFQITGGKTPQDLNGKVLNSFDDHRIAMALTLLSSFLNDDESFFILNPKCTKKSYERFWHDYRKLGGNFDLF